VKLAHALAAAALLSACPALGETQRAPAQAGASVGLPLPLNLGGPFSLTDQFGRIRTQADPQGHLQLIFFGYANCESICMVALPQMATLAEALAARGVPLTPVMITVDPDRDTPGSMAAALAKLHPDFVGLTGPAPALAAAYKAFAIESSVVFTDPAGAPVYAHGSLLYLLDGKGRFLTVLPPILADETMIEIISGYAPKV
jgi:protein SCO1/2